ncbi:ATP-binding protein [Mangrovibacillus cuniculi]|uniref:histidine kinase n=1 Tax=Mangrovibacillus cuniculi TaxID=2593652 RepID=A0A7S8HEH6_9BACI|nr:ATP-binding protein [Mangrovibacillus cuniculi]QPC45727.1 PAS domain S-box protein [Mangrovibacillus cuniculi]
MKTEQRIAFKVAIIYVFFGVAWIFISDLISFTLAQNKMELYLSFQRSKGAMFVILTGILLYWLVLIQTKKEHQVEAELLKKERQLLRRQQHVQSLFFQNPDAVIEYKTDGTVKAMNKMAEHLLRSSAEERIGKTGLPFISEDKVKEVRQSFERALLGVPDEIELQLNESCDSIILRNAFLPIVLNEKVVGVYGIARDITQEKQQEELVLSSEKLALVGQLAASVAHEIRNPLTSIKGFVQLMETTKEVNPEHVSIMLSEIDRIHLIASEMLVLGKKQDVPMKKVHIQSIISKVIYLMDSQAHSKNVPLKFIDTKNEPLYVYADENQLKQVLVNLIKNGIEATDNHKPVVVEVWKENNRIELTVSDQGVGIEEEKLASIGQPFFSTKNDGTGLGLEVCKRIVERHQGEIDIQSKPNEGTIVNVTLPAFE